MDKPDSSVAIVAEKPSVARDIARVVGANKQGDGFLHGNGHVVTWAEANWARLMLPQAFDENPDRWWLRPTSPSARAIK
jgi:DNA topoisomerase III